jgi:K(+)-stimulated pyrophosphate-energized sodium pump
LTKELGVSLITLIFTVALPLVGLAGLALAFLLYRLLLRKGPPDQQVALDSEETARSVTVFLKRETTVLAFFMAVTSLAILRWVSGNAAAAFIVGGLVSTLAVVACARIAGRSAALAVKASEQEGHKGAVQAAFSGANACGLIPSSACLISLSFGYFLTFRGVLEPVDLAGFVLGATTVSLLHRLAGGVFSKSADLAASLASGVEPGLGEDDLRNPARIAALAGSQLGNLCAAMAELFEASAAAMVATTLIASSGMSSIVDITGENRASYMSLPAILAGIGLVGALVALLCRWLLPRWDAGSVFRAYHAVVGIVTLGGAFLVVNAMELEIGVFYAVLLGVIAALVAGLLTEWYTSGPPVKRIAQASLMGSVTNLLAGLTVGMQSTALPILTISGAILIAYNYAGIYGIGVAAVGMLTGAAGLMTVSAFGPIVDGASAIIRHTPERSQLASYLGRLRLTGAAASAVSKSFLVAATALSAIALLSAYARLVGLPSLDLINPTVIVGFFLGGVLPFFVSDSIITSIGKAAFKQLDEVRRQFDENAKLRAGEERPDSRRYAIVSAWSSIREIVLPVLIAVVTPVAIGEILGRATLGGMLAGALSTGMLLAFFMIHSGTAWENTRTHVELELADNRVGNPFAAASAGRLLGNPLKDACGPAITVLVRLVAITALVIVPLLR